MTNEEAIKQLKYCKSIHNGSFGVALKIAIKALEKEPKTGHWKRVSGDKYVQHSMYYYRCSECDEDIIGKHNYCPNCGAKMVEQQESEER